MSGKGSKRAGAIPPFHVMELLARAQLLELQGKSVVHLEVGEPDFNTPKSIIEAGVVALSKHNMHYTPATGLPELREVIAQYYQDRYSVEIPSRRIIITPGASGALQLALSVLIDNGDDVLLPDPGYPCNKNIVNLLNGNATSIPVSSVTDYQLTDTHIENHWKETTRVAMVASPSNPTGTTIKLADMRLLAEAVNKRSGSLIVDEIYQGLLYEGDDYTALSITDNIFVINSFSKYFGMTGWRLGWIVVPDEFVDAIDRVAQNIFLAPTTVSQYAALAAFSSETQKVLQERAAVFKQRRDFLLPKISSMGFDVASKPQGAFYIYADCSEITHDSYLWVNQLLDQQAVALTPGIDFGVNKANTHVRFAYTKPVDQLECACDRISRFIH